MNTADAMDRLAGADPFPDGLPTPPFEPVLRRLDEQEPSATAPPRAARGFSSRRWEPGWVLPAMSLLVVGVVLAAVALLVHRGAQSPPATGPARSQSLLSQFGILRRPQTPRDRRLPRIVKNMLGVAPQRHDLLPSLTRVVGEFPSRGEGRVLFVAVAHGARPAHPREVWLMMVTSASDGAGGAGASPFTPGELFPQIGDGYASELVPDAVTRVKWVFGGRTVYPAIRDNVAVAPASVPRGTGPGLKSVTWYDAGGRVLAYEDAATFQKRQAASEQRSIDREINPVLLRRFPVLNRPHTTADRLPSALQTITRRDRSLAPWLSQRVEIPGSRLVDWIVPGRDGYCRFDAERFPGGRTVTPALSEHCVSASNLITKAIALTTSGGALAPGANRSSGNMLATAFLPTIVTSVTVVHSDRSSVPVPITDGMIAAPVSPGDRIYLLIKGRRHLALRIRTPTP